MKTAVIYARYSSDSQTEQSIEGQLRVCEEYAERNDIVILDTYVDRAMTGTNDNRPDFQRMIKDSSKKEWNFVLVYKLDRFSRNKYETTLHKHTLSNNGVKVLSAMENIPDTPEGIILESLLEGMNQYYSAELSQKVKRGMNETRLKGNFTGGIIIYGYRVENHKVIINEEQAEVVKFIYKQYSLGVYVKDIMQKLNEQHIYNKGKPFARNTIYNILKSEKYSGIYRHENQVFDNIYPQIIPIETYEIVRKKIDQNKYGKRSVEVVYMLRNKLKCGYCGMPISAECGTTSNGKKIHYYKCSGRKHKNGCKKSTIRKEILEEFIIKAIIKQLSKKQAMDKLVKNLLKVQEEQNSESSTLKTYIKQRQQKEAALNNIMNAVEQGIINKTTNKRMKDLESELEELKRKMLIERSKTKTKVTDQDIRRYYKQALKNEPQMIINYLVKEIKLYDDKVEITFNSPLKKNSDNQGSSFLSFNSKMKHKIQNMPMQYIEIKVEMYV